MNNREIAASLEGVAKLLELQEANPFRIRSDRRAADHIRQLETPVSTLYRNGGEAQLRQIEGVGNRLAGALKELIETGRLRMAERLQSELVPEALFMQIPGIGPELADRIQDELGITTLEELELAAHDGRLARVEGVGRKRLTGIRHALTSLLSRPAAGSNTSELAGSAAGDPPAVKTLLELDEEYRRRAAQGDLPRVAPRRFNPSGEKWLPIMRTTVGEWDVTLLYSNTKRAHDLNKTHDWVVIYYEKDGEHDQCTVVTDATGEFAHKRVVRGREAECRSYYASLDVAIPPPS